jgi:two-component system, OmpR family, phosphate regulon sensor histidine kinase PhoR
MSYTDQNRSKPQNLLWLGGVVGLGASSGTIAYAISQSLGTAGLTACAVLACFGLGWWASRVWARGSVDQVGPEVSSTPVTPVFVAPTPIAGAANGFARSAMEATINPVIIIDGLGRVITTNLAARARFSIGSSPTLFNKVVRRPDVIEAVEAVIADKQPRSFAIDTRVPVARFERVSVTAFEADDTDYVLVSFLDETDARMSERMRADFLANASHELRTPLAAIIGFIETLRGPARDDTKAREKFLEVMHVQADRMSRLISELLSLSRIELNEHVPPTQLSDIASAAFEAVDGLTPDKKSRLVVDASKSPIWVLGDRDEMAQVLVNLIDNALKYSSAGSKVRLSVRNDLVREEAITLAMRQWGEHAARLPLTSPEVERSRLYSVIRVENDGEGIERQFLPRLSERFFRIEDTASGKSGTGLGLAIVKHIVSRHRGGLVVESERGRGSAFSVYLPQPFDLVPASHISATPTVI